MDQKTTYEITITEKLQQLPVPDMADAIWSRIETQLDLDMPTDDGNGQNDSSPVNGGGSFPYTHVLLIFVAAVITVFFILKNNGKGTNAALPVNIEGSADTPVVDNSAESPPEIKKNISINSPVQDSSELESELIAPADDGSNSIQPDIRFLQDSTTQNISSIQSPPTADSSKPKPKTKGVTGLSDNDYRIVPAKKDSSKN